MTETVAAVRTPSNGLQCGFGNQVFRPRSREQTSALARQALSVSMAQTTDRAATAYQQIDI